MPKATQLRLIGCPAPRFPHFLKILFKISCLNYLILQSLKLYSFACLRPPLFSCVCFPITSSSQSLFLGSHQPQISFLPVCCTLSSTELWDMWRTQERASLIQQQNNVALAALSRCRTNLFSSPPTECDRQLLRQV